MVFSFFKFHGLGNDFIFIHWPLGTSFLSTDFVKFQCHRNQGIGADGVVFWVLVGTQVLLRIYNADGSRAQTCGNALRCLGLLLYREGLWDGQTPMAVVDRDTQSAISQLCKLDALDKKDEPVLPGATHAQVTVEMGCWPEHIRSLGWPEDILPDTEQTHTYWERAVDLLNPHWVLYSPKFIGLSTAELLNLGARLQALSARLVPAWSQGGANIGFLSHWGQKKDQWQLSVYERGAGLTQCCGSGATAAHVALVCGQHALSGVVTRMPGGTLAPERSRPMCFHLPGGPLEVWNGGELLFLKGQASYVFKGEGLISGHAPTLPGTVSYKEPRG